MVQPMWIGFIKAALIKEFQTSAESHLNIYKKPEVTVKSLKAFAKPGQLVVVPLSRNIQFIVRKE